jgi:nitrite reductase/ring-hydroxylating ferredoxin subunit
MQTERPAPNRCKGVTVEDEGTAGELFVMRDHEQVCAYENRCPQTGGSLDWSQDQFLDEEGKLIVCATHLALFRIHDGYCVAGPCAGARLRTLDIRIDNGLVFLDE